MGAQRLLGQGDRKRRVCREVQDCIAFAPVSEGIVSLLVVTDRCVDSILDHRNVHRSCCACSVNLVVCHGDSSVYEVVGEKVVQMALFWLLVDVLRRRRAVDSDDGGGLSSSEKK